MKRRRSKQQSFKELEAHWYKKLEESGFDDIEETSDPDRPLKAWHSRRFRFPDAKARKTSATENEKRLSEFLNGTNIMDICDSISRHGNNKLTKERVMKIIELHREGRTHRKIARTLRCSKAVVFRTLLKVREWMAVA